MENNLEILVSLFSLYEMNVPFCLAEELFGNDVISRFIKKNPAFSTNKDFLGKESIELSKRRFAISQKKLDLAKKRLRILNYIPWIKFVAVSGSVAFFSAQEEDDIDLFIVTENNRLWIVRGLMLLVLGIMGWRRRFGNDDTADKFCLNYFVSEGELQFRFDSSDFSLANKSCQEFLTAIEIAMLRSILKREYFASVIEKNRFLDKYFPYFCNNIVKDRALGLGKTSIPVYSFNKVFNLLDSLAFKMQCFYMKILNHEIKPNSVSKGKAMFFEFDGWKVKKDFLSRTNF